jgi:hypothetical protein
MEFKTFYINQLRNKYQGSFTINVAFLNLRVECFRMATGNSLETGGLVMFKNQT